MHTLNVPTAGISEVKRSPRQIFKRAEDAKNGVYVFNRGTVVGVMLTQEQYESLSDRIDALVDQLIDVEAERRLAEDCVNTYTDAEVRGKHADLQHAIDMDDGWN